MPDDVLAKLSKDELLRVLPHVPKACKGRACEKEYCDCWPERASRQLPETLRRFIAAAIAAGRYQYDPAHARPPQ